MNPANFQRLLKLLSAQGTPLESVVLLDETTTPPVVRIDFRAEATTAQRTQANSIASDTSATAWWRARRLRSEADLEAALLSLPTAQKNRLVLLAALSVVRSEPDFLTRFGINVSGEEIAP